MPSSTSPRTSSIFISFAILVVIAPIGALYSAWIFSSIWDLLVRPQYGAGPSYAAWYGFALLFSLAMSSKRKKDDDADITVGKTIKEVIVNALFALLVLGIAHGVRAVLGWP